MKKMEGKGKTGSMPKKRTVEEEFVRKRDFYFFYCLFCTVTSFSFPERVS